LGRRPKGKHGSNSSSDSSGGSSGGSNGGVATAMVAAAAAATTAAAAAAGEHVQCRHARACSRSRPQSRSPSLQCLLPHAWFWLQIRHVPTPSCPRLSFPIHSVPPTRRAPPGRSPPLAARSTARASLGWIGIRTLLCCRCGGNCGGWKGIKFAGATVLQVSWRQRPCACASGLAGWLAFHMRCQEAGGQASSWEWGGLVSRCSV
jgi:hypothetical protein